MAVKKIEIKSRWDGRVLFSYECEDNTLRLTVLQAVQTGANLSSANLSGADLSGANLSGTYLSDVDLSGAYLSGTNLSDADLSGTNLSRADLSRAYLSGANLSDANLSGADLSGADLSGAYLKRVVAQRQRCPEEGTFVAFKKISTGIAKLLIPTEAKRVSPITGRKCRAEFAEVLEGEGTSLYNPEFTYKPGQTVRPDEYDPSPLVECSHGIHFFISRQEAEEFNYYPAPRRAW